MFNLGVRQERCALKSTAFLFLARSISGSVKLSVSSHASAPTPTQRSPGDKAFLTTPFTTITPPARTAKSSRSCQGIGDSLRARYSSSPCYSCCRSPFAAPVWAACRAVSVGPTAKDRYPPTVATNYPTKCLTLAGSRTAPDST